MTLLPSPAVPWELFEEHLAESAFLFDQRAWALGTHDHSLADVRDGEELRIQAHVDALVLGGQAIADKLLVPALAGDEPGLVTTAALSLLWSEHGPRGPDVVAALREGKPEHRAPLLAGLELAGRRDLVELVWPLLGSEAPALVAGVLRLLARLGIPLASVQRPLLAHADAEVASAALESVELGQVREHADWVSFHLARPDGKTRAAALRAGLALGAAEPLRLARSLAGQGGVEAEGGLLLLGLSGGVDDANLLAALADKVPGLRRAALVALGHTGRVAAADACVDHLTGEHAHLAGEAFSAITGLVLRGEYVRQPAEKQEPVPIEEEDLDAPAVETQEDRLPLPDGDAVRGWWKLNRLRFLADRRFLRGEPMSAAKLLAELAGGPVRRCEALSLELLVRSRGALRVSRSGWAAARLRSVPSVSGLSLDGEAPFDRFLT